MKLFSLSWTFSCHFHQIKSIFCILIWLLLEHSKTIFLSFLVSFLFSCTLEILIAFTYSILGIWMLWKVGIEWIRYRAFFLLDLKAPSNSSISNILHIWVVLSYHNFILCLKCFMLLASIVSSYSNTKILQTCLIFIFVPYSEVQY